MPIKIMGNKAFVEMVDFSIPAITRNLRAMPREKEKEIVAWLGIGEQPFQPLADALGGGAIIQNHAYVIRREPEFLQ